MTWHSPLAALLIVVGLILPPLHAVAATIPALFAYDVAVQSMDTARINEGLSLRPERGGAPEYAYDAVLIGYDGAANPQVVARAVAVRVYGPALNFRNRREVGEGVIYAAPAPTTAAEAVSNPIPQTLARVIGGDLTVTTLGRLGTADVFVTAAEDIAGMSPAQIAERLTIPQSSTFTIYTFEAPAEGLASPVLRSDPGFVGGGLTAGGAREFVLPNGPIPAGAVRTVVGP